MKTKKMILVAAMTIGAAALTAFTLMPNSPEGEKTPMPVVVSDGSDDYNPDKALPCACSDYRCGCGTKLSFSFEAYTVDVGPCKLCKGTGQTGTPSLGYSTCGVCEGTGRKLETRSGCVCENCGNVYEQPDDC